MSSEQYLMANSTGGGSFTKTLTAGVNAVLQADTGIQSCLVWTALTDCYINFGAAASSANALLPPNTWTPVPLENLDLIQLVSAAGGDIYYMYRTR